MNRTTQLNMAFAIGRAAFGAALIASPGALGSRWLGDDARRAPTKVPVRGLAARDIALGGGLALATTNQRDTCPWLAAIALSDLSDVASVLVAGDAIPARARIGTVAIAGASAIAGVALILATGER